MDQRRRAIFVAFHDVDPGHHLRLAGRVVVPELRRAFDRTMEEVRGHYRRAARKARAPTSISDLVNARDQGDKPSVIVSCSTRFLASAGATLSATSRAAGAVPSILLYTHPEQFEQLIRNPALIQDALEECYRLAMAISLSRACHARHRGGGTHILKGMVVRPSPLAPKLRSRRVSEPDALRHSSLSEPDTILRCGPASLHREHSLPYYHHQRNPPLAGALS